jgi:signal-transduction protein with cAMP-binding, CBS, and nucleotidyltransferase domain
MDNPAGTKTPVGVGDFFDFRPVCGDRSLVVELGKHVQQLLAENPSFLAHLAREGVNYRTPLGLFGKIHTESDEQRSESLNIKSPSRVIVNLVRLYAMKHQVPKRIRYGESNGSMKKMCSVIHSIEIFSMRLTICWGCN